MNYWLGCGVLVLSVGMLLHRLSRRTRRRIRDEGLQAIEAANSMRAVGLGYVLPALGGFLVVVGVVEMLR